MLKLLVDLLSSSSKDLVISTLRLTHLLMLKYDWRVSFATEGGVKSILSCMQEFSSVTQVQQLALAVSDIHHDVLVFCLAFTHTKKMVLHILLCMIINYIVISWSSCSSNCISLS